MKTLSIVIVMLLGLGCGQAEDPQAVKGDQADGTDRDYSALTDPVLCQKACSKLSACGVPYGEDCQPGCMLAPVFRACARQAAGDCNALALCAFKQHTASACGDVSGVPAGRDSCAAVAHCQGICVASGQPASCGCACQSALAPDKALRLLINDQCAVTRCAKECFGGREGAACLSCFKSKCSSESAQCAAS